MVEISFKKVLFFFFIRVTAYALDILSEGVESEWQEYLFVDTNVLNELASYVISMQDTSNGAFLDTNENIYDNKLWVTYIKLRNDNISTSWTH